MKISQDYESPQGVIFGNAQCWKLQLDLGGAEGGSSGAPYFNQAHRIIGQEYGVYTIHADDPCYPDQYGGRFDVSWYGGGTSTTRLSDWLDPSNSNALTTTTSNIASLIPDFFISGDNYLCSSLSNLYTIPNLPSGSTVTWTADPPGIVTINSPNLPQTTLTKNNIGFIKLTATITNICVGGNIVRDKQIGVGYTKILNIGYPSSTVTPNELIPMQIFIAPDSFVVGNQKLVITRMGGGYNNTLYTGGDGTVEFSFPTTGTYNIKVYTYNECGWSTNFYPLVFFCTNEEMFMLSPNPAHTELMVKLNDEKNQANNEKNTNTGIREIQLTDKMGNVLKRYVYSGAYKQVTIDVSTLKSDFYSVRVLIGKQWTGKSFMKQ